MQPSKQQTSWNWLLLLTLIYFVGWATTYLTVYKMTNVFHILEPGCVYLFPLSYIAADIITEVYGFKLAQQVLIFSLFAGLLFTFLVYAVVQMPSPHYWNHQHAYNEVFGHLPRAYFTTTFASVLGNWLNIGIVAYLHRLMKGAYFGLRGFIAIAVGELSFTIIGGLSSYLGVYSWEHILSLMINGYLLKITYTLIAIIPTIFIVKLLQKYTYSLS